MDQYGKDGYVWYISELTDSISQRNASSQTSSDPAAIWKNNALLAGSTMFAAGSVSWYYYQFGRPTHAMTPAEEG